MASWFTRALDRVTPWNRGGEVQRGQDKKKKKDEEQQYVRPNFPTKRVNQNQPFDQPLPNKPVNIFEDLNKGLDFGQPNNNVQVFKTPDVQQAPQPQPGTIIKPNQSIGNRFRDILDANTESDKYRRQEENKAVIDQKPINYRNPVVDFAKRNLAPTGVFNVGKEVVQAGARIPLELGQTVEQSFRASKEGTRLKKAGYTGTDKDELARKSAPSKTWVPSGWQARLFGDAPVKSLRDQAEDLSLIVQEKTGKKPSTTALTAAMVGSTIIPEGIIAKILGRGARTGASNLDELVEAGARNLDEVATRPRPIPVRQNIPVDEVVGDNLDIPVQVRTPQKPTGPVIRELGGDATQLTTNNAIADRAAQIRQAEAETVANATKPNVRTVMASNGLTPAPPKYLGEAGGVTKIEVDAERAMLDDALANKEINKTQHKTASKALDEVIPSDAEPGVGKKIEVKAPATIIDETVVPQNLPETPGTVRSIESTAPNNAKSEVVAAQTQSSAPTVVRIRKDGASVMSDGTVTDSSGNIIGRTQELNEMPISVQSPVPISIPKVGSTMPDGRVVTKRMVQSERNQRKNAKALSKAQDETAIQMEKINANNAPNNALDGRQPGLILSDDLKKGKKGVYQAAHQADQIDELGNKSVSQIVEEADMSIRTNGSLNDRDVANVKAALDSGTYKPGTPEYKKLSDLYWKDAGTHDAQRLALRNQSLHRTGSGKEISNRAVSKLTALADDPTKITDQHIADIVRTSDDYANLRDARLKASDDFNANPTKENHKRFMDLDKQAAKAEKSMAMAQYTAAKSSLKGNTNVKLRRLIEDAAEDADLYTMDYVDSALLSGTGTFVRNFVNASLGSLEEGLFGGIGARVGRAVKGTPIGGGVGRGSVSGFGKGAGNVVDATKTRAKNAGWNPIEHMKNWSTTGNQLGYSMIEGSIGRSVRNHYEQMLKKQGYVGDELRMRADVMARTDPDNLARDLYAPQARTDAGLGSGISKRSTFEKGAQRQIADGIAKVMGKEYSQGGEAFAKGITRITMGFPSAVGRSLVAGSQRLVPFANIDTVKALTAPNATLRAAAIKESIKKSGSAATAATVFGIMGANDRVTGAYPKDQNERDRWEREGIKENSIKIGDAWYDAPSYLGSFGLPVLAWASIGRNGGINKESLKDIQSIVGSISPTENISDINDVLDGRIDLGKYTERVTASSGRMATPYGSLLNQLSKVFDPTQNDTSSDTWTGGVLNKLIDGIPFVDSNLPDKTDKEGNPLYNPSVAETMVGAAGAVQKGGEERSQQINQKINDSLSQIDQYGLLDDSNLEGVLDGTGLEALTKLKSGRKLDESDVKALKEGLVKGVSSEGTDTAYLEREQYDTNLAVLKLKRDLMKEDKTVKPSSLKDVETAIKRGEIYKESNVPYELISEYQSVGVEEWRKMGIPPGDDDHDPDVYDADMYQRLWDIDQALTKAGVSYKKGALDKNKYFVKDKKGGPGSRGGTRQLDTSFGTLKEGKFAPQVQQYENIDQRSGSVPIIRTVRPNIVHKITSSR